MEAQNTPSRVLLPIGIQNEFFTMSDPRGLRAGHRVNFAFDPSAFRFIAEEQIAQGATRIALDPRSAFSEGAALSAIGLALKSRVDVIDSDARIEKRRLVLLKPIADELTIDLDEIGPMIHESISPRLHTLVNERTSERRGLLESLFTLEGACYHLLLGMHYRLQIDIDLRKAWFATQRLRLASRSPPSSTNLAFIESLLRGYSIENVGGLKLTQKANGSQLAASFEEFLTDETYRQLSEARYALGIPSKVRQAVTASHRLARSLVSKKMFSRLFNYGSRAVSVFTGLPLPNSDIAEAILTDAYLPAIADTRSTITAARSAWSHRLPDPDTSALAISRGGSSQDSIAYPLQRSYEDGTLLVRYDAYDFLEMFRMNGLPRAGDPEVERSFMRYFSKNLNVPTRCAEHRFDIGNAALEVEWSEAEVRFAVRACCEPAATNALAHLLAYDKTRDYSS